MSFFSPITERSPVVRMTFGIIYGLLVLGALTMVIPLLVTLAGSTSGAYDLKTFQLYPRFLTSEAALWSRYVDAKYGGMIENYRMASGEMQADFANVPHPDPEADSAAVGLWREFRREDGPLSALDAGLGFTRLTKREAALENRNFRIWLMNQYDGDLERLRAETGATYSMVTNILPPPQNRIYSVDVDRPLYRKFVEYLALVPESRRLYWNVGNFYRYVYLPRVYGENEAEGIAKYNAENGTSYSRYAEVPFPSRVPESGRTSWIHFVKRVLNPAFVGLTPEG